MRGRQPEALAQLPLDTKPRKELSFEIRTGYSWYRAVSLNGWLEVFGGKEEATG